MYLCCFKITGKTFCCERVISRKNTHPAPRGRNKCIYTTVSNTSGGYSANNRKHYEKNGKTSGNEKEKPKSKLKKMHMQKFQTERHQIGTKY
jgi:hypothetical protein